MLLPWSLVTLPGNPLPIASCASSGTLASLSETPVRRRSSARTEPGAAHTDARDSNSSIVIGHYEALDDEETTEVTVEVVTKVNGKEKAGGGSHNSRMNWGAWSIPQSGSRATHATLNSQHAQVNGSHDVRLQRRQANGGLAGGARGPLLPHLLQLVCKGEA